MNKYKVGDKIVLTVSDVNEKAYYSYYVFNNNDLILWEPSTDNYAEPLTTYTEPLESKIKNLKKKLKKWVEKGVNQRAEITRLLEENKRLKAENGNSLWNIEQARADGQNEAWELARKIVDDVWNGGYSAEELEQIFGYAISQPCIVENTYSEAAAKVAEWEKAKEEIKVGDVVSREGLYGVVKSVSDDWLNGITASGISFQWLKRKCTKTGRHIDIDSFLKQIGGGDDEK